MCYFPEWKPQCRVNWRRQDSGAGFLTFEQDLMSFYKVGELSLAVKCFDGGNGITSTLASRLLCGTDLVAVRSTEWNWNAWWKENTCRNRECFCSQGEEADMKIIVHVADAVESSHQSVMIRTFARAFFLAPCSPLSWSIKQIYLDLKEFGNPLEQKTPTTSYSLISLRRPLSYLNRSFHALIVCHTTSFSADHRIAKILNVDFCQFFFVIEGNYCCYWNHVTKYEGHRTCFCGRASESAHHLHSFRFFSED